MVRPQDFRLQRKSRLFATQPLFDHLKSRLAWVFVWSKRGWLANSPDFLRDLKSGSPAIWNPDKWSPFCQTFWNPDKHVWFQIHTVLFFSLPQTNFSYLKSLLTYRTLIRFSDNHLKSGNPLANAKYQTFFGIKEMVTVQSGLEFRTLEIRTHSKSEPFFVLFSNGLVFERSEP